jgi:hypothetical protein
MPATYFPEGNTSLATDTELRSLHKTAWSLYDNFAPGDSSPFPEGNKPLASDDEQRLQQKIVALMP